MKRILLSALALMLATAAVNAQADTAKSPHREHRRSEGPFAQLHLTAEQQAKLKTIRADFKQKEEALAAQKLTESERRTQLQALHEAQHKQVAAILTPDQNSQWETWRSQHKSAAANNNTSGRHLQKGGLMKELNLTAEQRAKLKTIRADFDAKAQTVRANNALNETARKSQLQALRKAQQEEIKTVLTKEQQEKWQTLRSERAPRNTK